jgi:clan AA aspartic protease (TIGR02281 family)
MFVDGAHLFVDSLEQPISMTLEVNTQRFFEGTFADLVNRARVAYRGKRWDESIDLFGRAFRQGTLERVEEARLAEVDRLLRESYLAEISRLRDAKRLDEASEIATTALSDFDRDDVLWLQLGEIRVEQRRHRDSITALLEARALKASKRVDTLLESEYRALATESLNTGDDRVAELAYIDGIEQLEHSGVLRLDLGRLYLRWKAYEDSIQLLQEAKQLDISLREQADILLEKIDDILSSRDAVVISIPEGSSSIRAKVVVNQQLETSFLIDTGATYTSISSAVARQLGYDPERGPSTIVNTAGGPKRVRIVQLTSLSLAGYSVRNLDVFILPAEAGSLINLLGLNFLKYFKYSVDSKRREFRLERQ